MESKYNRDIDASLSMGENALLYYEDILDKKVLNRIIISTVLKLNQKGYVELDKNDKNKLIIKIKEGTEKLRKSEVCIYDCLKTADLDGNSVITLDELDANENKVFAKNKQRIKKLIIQEAVEDNLIDYAKYRQKRRIFFRALEILLLIMLTFWVSNMKIILGLIVVFIPIFCIILCDRISSFSYEGKHVLKSETIDKIILNSNSKDELKNIYLDIIICLIVYYANIFWLEQLSKHIDLYMLSFIEIVISLIIAIIEYIRYRKANVYTHKAIEDRKKLRGLDEYLKDYSLMEKREAIEVHFWEDYLAYAVLLGINRRITDEMKINLPNINEKSKRYYDYYENRYRYKEGNN